MAVLYRHYFINMKYFSCMEEAVRREKWRERLIERAAAWNVAMAPQLADNLAEYLELLARWNSRMNLTAFDLSAPSDVALDRLAIEPVRAAVHVRREDRRALDIGSGGGSPAVPLALASPWLEMTMVEARVKKAAFLREVARVMPVALRVESARVEDLAAEAAGAGAFDLVTFRAVRPDKGLWRAIDVLLARDGRVLWFGGDNQLLESEVFAVSAQVDPVVIVERR